MRDKAKQAQGEQPSTARATALAGSMAAPMAKKTSRNSVYVFAVAVFLIVAGVFALALWTVNEAVALIGGALIGLLVAASVRIAPQWERVVILRLGRFDRIGGPGLYFVAPIVESVAARVDQRMITTPFSAEEALTADLVPLGIDAVLFWMVWDPKDACVEVEDYSSAVWWAAQTALRDAVGRINLAEVATRREQLDNEVKEILEEKTRTWGITVISVEIRDIAVPSDLQDALSKEAQAERERNSRLLLAEVEKDISEMFVEAASVYEQNDKALQLRTMNLIYESVKEKGGLIIAPSAFGEAFNNIEGFLK
ncbi:slipin family protein [uncultured Adlercreutzia sp.]|uniref:slipin family protein n=2 Tax=uncultured Adlercreutzia sp. TaxID=875803 RepID=UPI0025CCD2BC|nr:slipin family protein [uncultured Adlercreutzia sp.]MCI9262404.1 slipin family protein [Eggerthellaceae bacterium]